MQRQVHRGPNSGSLSVAYWGAPAAQPAGALFRSSEFGTDAGYGRTSMLFTTF